LRPTEREALHTPCIIISGDLSQELVDDALLLGAFEVYSKPVDLDKLVASLGYAINFGISLRTLLVKCQTTLSEADLKSVGGHIKNMARLRALNWNRKKGLDT